MSEVKIFCGSYLKSDYIPPKSMNIMCMACTSSNIIDGENSKVASINGGCMVNGLAENRK